MVEVVVVEEEEIDDEDKEETLFPLPFGKSIKLESIRFPVNDEHVETILLTCCCLPEPDKLLAIKGEDDD